jgi:ABC-type lipoprotein export system ATPase subunit
MSAQADLVISHARIELNKITHMYPDASNQTLTDISFTLQHNGKTIAVAGPSGSGKSTFLSILGGLQRPTGGHIEAHLLTGELCSPLDVVAWVFQTTNALPRRSTRANVALGAHANMRSAEASRLAEQCLDCVGLSAYSQRQARHLSGGELQRLGIARALAAGRPFMILDEPTGQLDAATSTSVLDAIFGQTTVSKVIATHDAAVMDRCDTVYIVNNGQLIQR